MGTTPENPDDPGFTLIDQWLASHKAAAPTPEESSEALADPEPDESAEDKSVMKITSSGLDPLTAPLPQVLEQEQGQEQTPAESSQTGTPAESSQTGIARTPESSQTGTPRTPESPNVPVVGAATGQLGDDERRARLSRMLKERLAPRPDDVPATDSQHPAPTSTDSDRSSSHRRSTTPDVPTPRAASAEWQRALFNPADLAPEPESAPEPEPLAPESQPAPTADTQRSTPAVADPEPELVPEPAPVAKTEHRAERRAERKPRPERTPRRGSANRRRDTTTRTPRPVEPEPRVDAVHEPAEPNGPRLDAPETFSVSLDTGDEFATAAPTDVFAALRDVEDPIADARTDADTETPRGSRDAGPAGQPPAQAAEAVHKPTHSGEPDTPRISDAAIMEPALQAVMRSIEQEEPEAPEAKPRRFGRRNKRSASSDAIRRAATPPATPGGAHANMPTGEEVLPAWLADESTPTSPDVSESVEAPAEVESVEAPAVIEPVEAESVSAANCADADGDDTYDTAAVSAPDSVQPDSVGPVAPEAAAEPEASPPIQSVHAEAVLTPEIEVPVADSPLLDDSQPEAVESDGADGFQPDEAPDDVEAVDPVVEPTVADSAPVPDPVMDEPTAPAASEPVADQSVVAEPDVAGPVDQSAVTEPDVAGPVDQPVITEHVTETPAPPEFAPEPVLEESAPEAVAATAPDHTVRPAPDPIGTPVAEQAPESVEVVEQAPVAAPLVEEQLDQDELVPEAEVPLAQATAAARAENTPQSAEVLEDAPVIDATDMESPGVEDAEEPATEATVAEPATEAAEEAPAKFETLEQLLAAATTRTGRRTIAKPVIDPEPDAARVAEARSAAAATAAPGDASADPRKAVSESFFENQPTVADAESAHGDQQASDPGAADEQGLEESGSEASDAADQAGTDAPGHDVPVEPLAEQDDPPADKAAGVATEPDQHAPFRAPAQDTRAAAAASVRAATSPTDELVEAKSAPTVPGPRTEQAAVTSAPAPEPKQERKQKQAKAPKPTKPAKPKRDKALPPLPDTVELSPQRGTRRFLGSMLFFAFMSTLLLGWLAWDVRTTQYIAFAATAGVLTLILWGAYSTAEPARIICERGLLDIRSNDSHHRFDLASPYTRIEVHGSPGRRGWKVHILRKSMPPYVINDAMVDPHEFTRILEHYEDARNRVTH